MIDTHCHLDCNPLRDNLPELLCSARDAGIAEWIVPGVHPADWARMSRVASAHVGVHCALGIHPMHADLVNERNMAELTKIAASGVAIGETGLDPLYSIPADVQELAFRQQIRLAISLDLPVMVHCRRSFQRTLQILAEEGTHRVGGIMHAFSGSPEMARQFIRLGFAISISGTVTWQNAVRPVRLAREVPLEWLVFETDAPDMTPQRYRGQANRPAWLRETLIAVAEMRSIPVDDLVRITVSNTRRMVPCLKLL